LDLQSQPGYNESTLTQFKKPFPLETKY
jgi:hypothetical protein